MLSRLFKAELLRYFAALPFNVHVLLNPPVRQKSMILSFKGVFIIHLVFCNIFKCAKLLWKAPLLRERMQWCHCAADALAHMNQQLPGGAPLPSDAEIGAWCRCPGLLVAAVGVLQGTPGDLPKGWILPDSICLR